MRRVALALGTLIVSACAGTQLSTIPNVTADAAKKATATITLVIPRAAARSVAHRQYVSPATQSLVLTVTTVNGSKPSPAFAPVMLNITPGTAQCPTPASGGAQTCTFSAILPTGSVGLTITTYDALQAAGQPVSGNALSTASLVQKLSGTGDTIALTLGGVVARVLLAPSVTQIPIGTALTIDITATEVDADNNVIVGTTPFASPATLTVSDPANRLTFTQATLSANGSTATLQYNGGSGFASATLAGTVGTGTVTPVTLTFVPGLVKSIALPAGHVTQMSLSPNGKTIYASLQPSGNGTPPAIEAVSLATSAVTSIPMTPTAGSSDVLSYLYNSSFSADGSTLYTVAGNYSLTDSYLEEISTSTNQLSSTLALGNDTFAVYVLPIPHSSNLAISDNYGAFDIFSTVTNANTTHDAQGSCYPRATCIAISPDGSTAYSAQNLSDPNSTGMYVNAVNVFSLTTGAMTASYQTDGMPYALLLSKDGSLLYVSEYGNNVMATSGAEIQIFSTATGALQTTYPLAAGAFTLALTPDSSGMAGESDSADPPEIFNPATGVVVSTIPIVLNGSNEATYTYFNPIFGSDGHTLYYLATPFGGSGTTSVNVYTY
jgi:hypothetical protein